MILAWVDQAQAEGARLHKACGELGLDPRTIQRWRARKGEGDQRRGPTSSPANKLSQTARETVLKTANSPEFRDKSPKQIVPLLADQGCYIASESTFYRVLHAEKQLTPRGRAKPRQPRPRSEHVAAAPNQVWSWDITYLKSFVAGQFYYLYLFTDIWSRKIVAYQVHERECTDLASTLLEQTLDAQKLGPVNLVVHSDNGSPMKGATLRATMERLGIIPSFSRPQVSDDNPYSEALFRTLKYRPAYPRGAFKGLREARQWVDDFVRWYNEEHLHSAIGFVTPESRHAGQAKEILEARREVYAQAKLQHPERWNGRATRTWDNPAQVLLNPSKLTRSSLERNVV